MNEDWEKEEEEKIGKEEGRLLRMIGKDKKEEERRKEEKKDRREGK